MVRYINSFCPWSKAILSRTFWTYVVLFNCFHCQHLNWDKFFSKFFPPLKYFSCIVILNIYFRLWCKREFQGWFFPYIRKEYFPLGQRWISSMDLWWACCYANVSPSDKTSDTQVTFKDRGLLDSLGLCTFLAKVKYTTETVRQRNFFETAQRISWNVLVMKDILTSVDAHLIQLELCLFWTIVNV